MPWPGTLPPLNETGGYTENLGDGSYHTPTDSGPGKTRPRPDPPNDQLNFDQLYTSAQVDTLKTYYTTTLSGGALTFVENHPRTGASTTFRFVTPPSFPHISGQKYRAQFVLEEMP